jgi:hypothetical protein
MVKEESKELLDKDKSSKTTYRASEMAKGVSKEGKNGGGMRKRASSHDS